MKRDLYWIKKYCYTGSLNRYTTTASQRLYNTANFLLCKKIKFGVHPCALLLHGSDLGIQTFSDLVHFFYIGGILPLPYQFYHHAHKMLCDRDQSEKDFSSRYRPPTVPPLLMVLTVIYCYNPLPYCPCGNHDPYAEYTVQLCLVH